LFLLLAEEIRKILSPGTEDADSQQSSSEAGKFRFYRLYYS